MADESVVALIKDFTAKLSAVAEEFSGRADQVQHPDTVQASVRDDAAKLDLARVLLDQRRLRRDFLPDELFHEPAWDMLLALYLAWHEGRTMNVKTLVGASDVPVTTSQRWIDHLAKLNLVTRVVDPADRRRIEVSLSQDGLQAIEGYLGALA
jgi:DNA-binding MarR family transcriptional regulator